MSGVVHDVITHANFCEDRLRVLAWRGVEFWPFPLTYFVAFKTLSHYRASVRWDPVVARAAWIPVSQPSTVTDDVTN